MIRRSLALQSPKLTTPSLSRADALKYLYTAKFRRHQWRNKFQGRQFLPRRGKSDSLYDGISFHLAAPILFIVAAILFWTVCMHAPCDYVKAFVRRNSDGVKGSVQNSEAVTLSPLRKQDYEQYTIRMNTWKRPETLQLSLQHHVSCPGVAQIQVVWCADQGPVPDWLRTFHEKVIVEEHVINSLNERFRIQVRPPTLGILSLDDDVIRPCIAYDWAFYKWTLSPDRMVGFDPRMHRVIGDKWKYEQLSPTERMNQYSLTLTRCSFLHADYLDWYISSEHLGPLRLFVDQNFNCEDIGMSLAISSQTNGLPPLLADFWAVKSTIELDNSGKKISTTADHNELRDQCIDYFAAHLHLKDSAENPLQSASLRSYFDYGIPASNSNSRPVHSEPQYLMNVRMKVEGWKTNPLTLFEDLAEIRVKTSGAAYDAGLVEGTKPWKKRYLR